VIAKKNYRIILNTFSDFITSQSSQVRQSLTGKQLANIFKHASHNHSYSMDSNLSTNIAFLEDLFLNQNLPCYSTTDLYWILIGLRSQGRVNAESKALSKIKELLPSCAKDSDDDFLKLYNEL
jgi:hypothetical protein